MGFDDTLPGQPGISDEALEALENQDFEILKQEGGNITTGVVLLTPNCDIALRATNSTGEILAADDELRLSFLDSSGVPIEDITFLATSSIGTATSTENPSVGNPNSILSAIGATAITPTDLQGGVLLPFDFETWATANDLIGDICVVVNFYVNDMLVDCALMQKDRNRPNAEIQLFQTADTGNSIDNIDASLIFTKGNGNAADGNDTFTITTRLFDYTNTTVEVVETFTGNIGDAVPNTVFENVGLSSGTAIWIGGTLQLVGFVKNVPAPHAFGAGNIPDTALAGEVAINISIISDALQNVEDDEANATVLQGFWQDVLQLFRTAADNPQGSNNFNTSRSRSGILGLFTANCNNAIPVEQSTNGSPFVPVPQFGTRFTNDVYGDGGTLQGRHIGAQPFCYAQGFGITTAQVTTQFFLRGGTGATPFAQGALRGFIRSVADINTLDIITANEIGRTGEAASLTEITTYINDIAVETRPNINSSSDANTAEAPSPFTRNINIGAFGLNKLFVPYKLRQEAVFSQGGEDFEVFFESYYIITNR